MHPRSTINKSSAATVNIHRGMRVLLRSLKTNHFYAGPAKWVPCSGEAFAFQDLEHAGRAYRQEMMSEMELVLSYVHPDCELRLPIP